jgi:glycosyltransferase involved in cell wall biosynthesis
MNVVNNPAISRELSINGLRREKQYSWERCGLETLAVFEKVLANPTDY